MKFVVNRHHEKFENLYPIGLRTSPPNPSFLERIYDKTVSCWNHCAQTLSRATCYLSSATQLSLKVAMHLKTTFNPVTWAGTALDLLRRNSKEKSRDVDSTIPEVPIFDVEGHKKVLQEHRCESTLFEAEELPRITALNAVYTTFHAQTRKESQKLRAPIIQLMQLSRHRKETQRRLIHLFKNLQFHHRQHQFYLPSDTENNGDSLIDARELAEISVYEGLLGLSAEERKRLSPRLDRMEPNLGFMDQDLVKIKKAMHIPEILGKAAQDWSEAEIRGLIFAIIGFSLVNTRVTLKNLFYELSLDRIDRELNAVAFFRSLPQHNNSSPVDTTDYLLMIAKDLNRLKKEKNNSFPDAIFKSKALNSTALEGVRTSPIFVNHKRRAKCEINSLNLKNGQTVYTNPRQLRIDEGVVGPNPEQFCPMRFQNEGNAWVKLSFLPFGYGPHRCPGWSFGQDVIKVVLACTSSNHQRLHRFTAGLLSSESQSPTWNLRLLKSIHDIQWTSEYPLEQRASTIAERALKTLLQVPWAREESPEGYAQKDRDKKWWEIPSWLVTELDRVEKNQIEDNSTPFQELLLNLAGKDHLSFLLMLKDLTLDGIVEPMRNLLEKVDNNPAQLEKIANEVEAQMQKENVGFVEAVHNCTTVSHLINKHLKIEYRSYLESFNALNYYEQVMAILLGSISWKYCKPTLKEKITAKMSHLWSS